VAPWTGFWDRNFFGHTFHVVGVWMANPFVRGAVTGIGVITTLGGVRDLAGSILGRPATPPPPQPDSGRLEP
jgi:hypothetical protein